MTVQFKNNAFSTLAAGISDSATALTVASTHGARFPTITGSQYFYVTLIDSSNNLEIVKVSELLAVHLIISKLLDESIRVA